MLDILNKDFKSVINMFKEPKETTSQKLGKYERKKKEYE